MVKLKCFNHYHAWETTRDGILSVSGNSVLPEFRTKSLVKVLYHLIHPPSSDLDHSQITESNYSVTTVTQFYKRAVDV